MVRLLGRCLPIICMPRKKRQSFPICEQHAGGTKHQDEINKLFVRRVESIRVTHQGAVLKRQPFQTINERHHEHKKTKSKTAFHNGEKVLKADDTEFDCETHISDRQSKGKNRIKSKKKSPSKSNNNNPSRTRTPLEKFFNKTKKIKKPPLSPTPSSIIDIPEEDHDDPTSSISTSISSDWSSTTTYSNSHSSEKSNNLIDPIQRRQSMPIANLINSAHELKHRSCVESFYLGREHVRPSLSPPRAKTSLPKIKEKFTKNKTLQQQQQHAKSKQVLQNVRKMMKDQHIQDQHFNDARQRESVRL